MAASLVVSPPAGAAIRTDTTTVDADGALGLAPISPGLPGIDRVTVRADDVSGRIDVTGWFRSPLVNRKTSTALAHTALIVQIRDAFGSEVEADYCDWESGRMQVTVNLGKDTATVYATRPKAPPCSISPALVSQRRAR